MSAIGAMIRVICAASAHCAGGRASCKRQASGSNPLTGSQFSSGIDLTSSPIRGTNNTDPGDPSITSRVAKGHIKQLPSGSFRVSVHAGTDPLTRRAIRLKATAKTEQLR
jgi:hypothetical protein